MSQSDFDDSKRLYATGATFTAFIMAALRLSDPTNYKKIRETWPEIFQEFWERARKTPLAGGGNGGPPEKGKL